MKDGWNVRLFQTKAGKQEMSGENKRIPVYVYIQTH